MKRIDTPQKQEIVGGYDVMMCSVLGVLVGPLSHTLTTGQWFWATEMYAYNCVL
ncbi:hypothetical protein [Lacihabitans sp. LS3-19]|uniref:hypothetical protein n=1 Tax=Lacihabitans sp. LS3-19 TaxID=2487335 RepID=UPI0020CF5868|nr:hypothetical protein [Lacihabitans sp. LS3-19]